MSQRNDFISHIYVRFLYEVQEILEYNATYDIPNDNEVLQRAPRMRQITHASACGCARARIYVNRNKRMYYSSISWEKYLG